MVMARTVVVSPGVRESMRHVGEEAMHPDFASLLLRGIFAGWLIALMVWLLPFAEELRVVVIILIAYLVGISHFPHIVASAADVFFLVCEGTTTLGAALLRCLQRVQVGEDLGAMPHGFHLEVRLADHPGRVDQEGVARRVLLVLIGHE